MPRLIYNENILHKPRAQRFPILVGFILFCVVSCCARADEKLPNSTTPKSEVELRKSYDSFVDSLDTIKIVREYPKAIQNLLSPDPTKKITGLAILSASGEIEVIPWIVPHLDSSNSSVKIWAGSHLEKLVSSIILKRRNRENPSRVIINPLRSQDIDFRPLSWVIYQMLQNSDDGNSSAYAAIMIGYIGLKEFEIELRQLLESRHPAVSNAAKSALEMLDLPQKPNSR